MPISNYLRDALVQHAAGVGAYTLPTDLEIALFTVSPSGGGGGSEVSNWGTNYARQSISFDFVGGGEVENDVQVSWSCVGMDFGTVVAYAIFDDSNNLLYYENLASPQYVGDGDVALINTGGIRMNLY